MRIATANYLSKVGKTTTTCNLLHPRLPDYPIFAVESINESATDLGIKSQKLDSARELENFEELAVVDNALVDVGGSKQTHEFVEGLAAFEGIGIELVDRWIVPVSPEANAQRETASFLKSLKKAGAQRDRVRMLFVRTTANVGIEFAPLLKFIEDERAAIANHGAAIPFSKLYEMLNKSKTTIEVVVADNTDYMALSRAEQDLAERKKLIQRAAMQSMARKAHAELDAVFHALMA